MIQPQKRDYLKKKKKLHTENFFKSFLPCFMDLYENSKSNLVWSSKSRWPFDRRKVAGKTEEHIWEKIKENAVGTPFIVVGKG